MYDECKWWCQTGVGFPRLVEASGNHGKGTRWHCPCGRSWRWRGDHWRMETPVEIWVLNRYSWLFHPEPFNRDWWRLFIPRRRP